MADDLDRELTRAFVATPPIPGDDFIHRLLPRIRWRRRAQRALRLGALLSLVVLVGFAGHILVRVSLLATEQLGELLISPLGWALSLLIAAVVVRRGHLLRN